MVFQREMNHQTELPDPTFTSDYKTPSAILRISAGPLRYLAKKRNNRIFRVESRETLDGAAFLVAIQPRIRSLRDGIIRKKAIITLEQSFPGGSQQFAPLPEVFV